MSSHQQPFVVSMQPPNDGAQVGESPVGLGQTISEQHREIVVATDIKSVWNGGSEIGWVYHGSDNRDYFQANRSIEPGSPTARDRFSRRRTSTRVVGS